MGEKRRKSIQEDTREHLKRKDNGIFYSSRPIILRTEASYNQGLSADLLQKTDKGIQPVHFISRKRTENKKRYGQTEKDVLAIKWEKNDCEFTYLEPQDFAWSQHTNHCYPYSIK